MSLEKPYEHFTGGVPIPPIEAPKAPISMPPLPIEEKDDETSIGDQKKDTPPLN